MTDRPPHDEPLRWPGGIPKKTAEDEAFEELAYLLELAGRWRLSRVLGSSKLLRPDDEVVVDLSTGEIVRSLTPNEIRAQSRAGYLANRHGPGERVPLGKFVVMTVQDYATLREAARTTQRQANGRPDGADS